MLEAAISDEHRKFASKLLSDHGVPEWPEGEENVPLSYSLSSARFRWSSASTSACSSSLSEKRLKRIMPIA